MRGEGALLAGRAVALYGLSLASVASASLAWVPADEDAGLRLLAFAGALAAATLLGERLSSRLAAALEPRTRAGLRVWVAVAYSGLVLFGLATALVATGDPEVLAIEVVVFAALQGAFVLLAELLGSALGAVANALVLVVLAALRGGEVAAVAVTCYLALLVFFLTFDHFARQLAAYPAGPVSLLGPALRQAAGLAAPLVLGMTVVFVTVPPKPLATLLETAGAPTGRRATAEPLPGELARAYRTLLVLGVLGAALVFLLARTLRRDPDEKVPPTEVVEAERGPEEALPPAARRAKRFYPGRRGRIVRAYVRFLARAEAEGLRRTPSQTPAAIASALAQPAVPLALLTRLFVGARYGPDEPGEDDVRAAEAAARALRESVRVDSPRRGARSTREWRSGASGP